MSGSDKLPEMNSTSNPEDEDQLNRALRITASQTSGLCSGGAVLLYSHIGGDPETGRLRAAAGFRSADEARQMAARVEGLVRDAIQAGETQTADLNETNGGTALAIPLLARDHVVGAMLVAPTSPVSQETRELIDTMAWSTAIAIDHAGLSAHYKALTTESEKNLEIAEEKSDELLKLSEELFTQDLELLRNNEKLGKIEKLKNDFIEKMSRELRTPLNSIIESTITVLSNENENLSSSSQQTLRNALDEGTAFQRTLQNILDLWRVKQDEFPIEIQEVSMADVIDETIFSVQDTIRDKPIEIVKAIPKPLPRFRADLAKLNQLLFLLLDNAAKFTEQGTITIGARYADDRLHCWIADTGIGICPDDQKYIWNEFYQVDDRASNRYRGAGLGLTLVHDLLVLMDGDTLLDSEPGSGTRVEFSIPVVLA
jgi:signal transduction histidine kinase